MDYATATLGTPVKDSITGFSGILTGKAEYLHNQAQGLVEGKVNAEGKVPFEWIMLSRLVPQG